MGRRTKVIVRSSDRSVPERAYGVCVPVRLSRDGVPVCVYDARLTDGAVVSALTAAELAARGVRPLDDVLAGWRACGFRLFLELCRPAAESLSDEARAEREMILRRADAAASAAFAVPAACGCTELAEEALQAAYRAGFRQGSVWLVTDDGEVFDRYGGKSSRVPVCCLSPRRRGAGAVAAPVARGVEIGGQEPASRRSAGGGLGCQLGRGCGCDGACGVDFIVTDDPASIAD